MGVFTGQDGGEVPPILTFPRQGGRSLNSRPVPLHA
jgi:hypothetical protein